MFSRKEMWYYFSPENKGVKMDQKSKKPISYDAYQEIAVFYATTVNTKPFNAYYERPATLSLMPDVTGMKVLDAGCGAGFYAKWFVDHRATVIGLDYSEKMIAYSQELVGKFAKFFVADLNAPLKMCANQNFDIVNSSLTVHYLNDLDFTFSEFARILKPNGYFIFSIHHPAVTREWHNIENYHETLLVTDVWKGMNNAEVSYYHRSITSYTESLRKNGFIIEQILEPQPDKIVQEIDQDSYQLLSNRPTFLFFKTRLHKIEG
jgi:SAM-dependent methyltransferase